METKVLSPRDTKELIRVFSGEPFIRGPKHLEIHVTNKCNARCCFCNQARFQKGREQIPLKVFKEILTELHSHGVRFLRFSGGGEPTFHPDISAMLEFAGKLGLIVTEFSTNGILLQPPLFSGLIRCRTGKLVVSLNSASPKTWSRINGRREKDFYKVIDNIRRFSRYDKTGSVEIGALFLINELTYKELPGMLGLCKDLGIKCLIQDLNNYRYSRNFRTQGIPRFLQDFFRLAGPENISRFYFFNVKELRFACNGLGECFKKISSDSYPCIIPWVSVLIRSNGDVYPCCNAGGSLCRMGNIFKNKFMDIWLGDKFDKWRNDYNKAMWKAGKTAGGPASLFDRNRFQSCSVKRWFRLNPAVDIGSLG